MSLYLSRILTALPSILVSTGVFAQVSSTIPAPGSAGTVNASRDTVTSPAPTAVLKNEKSGQSTVSNAIGSEARVKVLSIAVEGNSSLSSNRLIKAAQEALTALGGGADGVSLDGLHSIARSLTAVYRDAGYAVAVVVLPQQELTEGRVLYKVFEGRLDTIDVKSTDEAVRRVVQSVAELQLPSSHREALLQSEVERAVLLAGEISGSNVDASFKSSQKVGGANLELRATPSGEKYRGSVRVDNYGADATGVVQTTLQLAGRSVAKLGDNLIASTSATERASAIESYSLSYDAPVGVSGWAIGARVWSLAYTLGGPSYQSLNYKGTSAAQGVYANYALVRSFDKLVDLRFGYNKVVLKDELGVAAYNARDRNAEIVWVDARGSFNDQLLFSPAYSQWGAAVNAGVLTINSPVLALSDSVGLRTAGEYSVLSLDYLRDQAISGAWSARVDMRGQFASKNLDSYHKFSIGGSSGVRAFPQGEASGDDGWLLRAELAHNDIAPFGFQGAASRIAVFYDQGWVKYNVTPLASATTNTTTRAGYGVQWQWTQKGIAKSDQLALRVFWAQSDGSSQVSEADGKTSRAGAELSYRF